MRTTFIALALLTIASPSYALEARSYFTDGEGTSGDSFPGAVSKGWKKPWEATAVLHDESYFANSAEWPDGLLASIVQVSESTPLSDESTSHLEIVHTGASDGARGFTLMRPLVLDKMEPYRVSFKVRVDSLSGNTASADSFYLRLAATSGEIGKTGTSGSTGWWAQVSPAHDREWLFVTNHPGGTHEEFSFISSGMKMEPGKVYHFTFRVEPQQKTYTATLSDGENTVTKEQLGFRDSSRPLNLNYLSFGSVAQRQVGLRYSLGEITITDNAE